MRKLLFLLFIPALSFGQLNNFTPDADLGEAVQNAERILVESYISHEQKYADTPHWKEFEDFKSMSYERKSNLFYGTFYITPTGGGVHDGSSEANAYNFPEALDAAIDGDYFNWKAGNYGIQQRTFNKSGSSDLSRIEFVGYITNPGDITAVNGQTWTVGGLPSAAEGPVIIGTTTTNRPDQDQGLRSTGNFVTWKNFAIAYYNRPFESTGADCIVDNYYSFRSGNHNPPDLTDFSANFPTGAYTGFGARMQGNRSQINNSYILDAGAEGVKWSNANDFTSDYVTVEAVLGVGPQSEPWNGDGNGTDYHYLLANNTRRGLITNLTVKNGTGFTAPGHGPVCKPLAGTDCIDHIFDGITAINTYGAETQFPETKNIRFKNGVVTSTDTGFRRESVGARIANGSEDVVVENYTFNGSRYMSWGWKERSYTGPDYNLAAVRPRLINSKFINTNGTPYSAIGVSTANFGQWNYPTVDMKIDHVTVDGYYYLFEVSKPNSNTDITNIVVDGVTQEVINRRPSYTGGFDSSYAHSNFSNGGFTPTGTNITSLDPQFANQAGGDYTIGNPSLQGSSIATVDFSGGLDIGYLSAATPPPAIPIPSNITTSNITDSAWRTDWQLNIPGTRYIEWEPDATYTPGVYTNQTPESVGHYLNHFWTTDASAHPGELIHFRVAGEGVPGPGTEYASADQTVQLTNDNPTPPPPDPDWQNGLLGRGIFIFN